MSAPARHRIDRDTRTNPREPALQVVRELADTVGVILDSGAPTRLAQLAQRTYRREPAWRRQFRERPVPERRRLLTAYMRAWIAREINDLDPELYAILPKGYATGHAPRKEAPRP